MTPAPEKTYIVDLTESEIGRFLAALDEAPHLIAHARSICDALYAMVSQDQVSLDEMTGFLDMSARGLTPRMPPLSLRKFIIAARAAA